MGNAGRIAIGTAQFGMDYGIANSRGRVAKKAVFKMLEEALREGINCLDTASAYGASETVIGEFLASAGKDLRVTAKLPSLERADALSAEAELAATLERLGRDKVYGYLAHRSGDILSSEGLWREMRKMVGDGLVEKIGASVYRTDELDALIGGGIDLDIVQLPYNVFDRRFKPYFGALKEKGVEIHVRSVFLQGLFFLGMDKIERDFPAAGDAVALLRDISARRGIPVNALCLCFALLEPGIDKVVVGMDSIEQLRGNIGSLAYLDRVADLGKEMEKLELHDEDIILPYNWR